MRGGFTSSPTASAGTTRARSRAARRSSSCGRGSTARRATSTASSSASRSATPRRVGDPPTARERRQERLLHGLRDGRARPREEGDVDDAVGAARSAPAWRSPSTSATRACIACASDAVLQLTEDHTLINYKVKHGMMTKAEAEKAARQERHHARGRPQGLRPGRHRRHRRRGRRPLPAVQRRPARLLHERQGSRRAVRRRRARGVRRGVDRAREPARRQGQHHRRRDRSLAVTESSGSLGCSS